MPPPDHVSDAAVRSSPSAPSGAAGGGASESDALRAELARTRAELERVREQNRALHWNALVDEIGFWNTSAALTRAQAAYEHARAQLARQQGQIGPLRALIRSIERSRLWRLRDRWLNLKHRLGLAPSGAPPPYPFADVEEPAILHDPFALWRTKFAVRDSDAERMRRASAALALKPLISVVMPVYAPPETLLREAIESVIAQAYPHWELCIADDASPGETVRAVLEEYRALDPRIKVVYRAENGHISRSSNSALALASGEFVSFLDHDDVLAPDALFEVALALNAQPDLDYIYSDEDKIDEAGTYSGPFFKPDWCPDSFLGRMYTCHFGTIRRSLVEAVGGFRPEFDGSQDYDLVLRVTERTERVHHIPRILYHWRRHDLSAASNTGAKSYAYLAGKKAIEEALERRGEPGEAIPVEGSPGAYLVRFALREPGRVSIIIPTRDHHEDVERCLASIFADPRYPDFEVVLLDNGSRDPRALASFAAWQRREPRVRVVRHDVPFNYSEINNYAAAQATGEYLLFLNNDTEVITPDWLTLMMEWAQRPAIGAVGAKLLYEDDTIQHAGVVVAIGGVAGHGHKYFSRDAVGYYNSLTTVCNYSAVTAACLMIRREAFDAVNGFDEKLAVAFNDVDFCLRLRRAGYRNVCLPHVELYHYESKSRGLDDTPEKQSRSIREQLLMQERWRTASLADPCYSPHLSLTAEDYSIRL